MQRRNFLRAVCGLPVAGLAGITALASRKISLKDIVAMEQTLSRAYHRCPGCGKAVASPSHCCDLRCFAQALGKPQRPLPARHARALRRLLGRRTALAVDRDTDDEILNGRADGKGGFLVPPSIATQLLSPGASDMSDGIDS